MTLLAEFDIGKIAIHKPPTFDAKGLVAGLDALIIRRVDVLAADHKVYGAAERVGYLPSGGQRNATFNTITSTLVPRIG